MTTQQKKYWVTSIDGAKAVVEGADERDRWTRVHGWSETDEPAAGDMVWLEHEVTHGRQVFSAEAAPQWAGLGWHPTSPPEPRDLTKDPQLVDQQPEPAAPAKPKSTAAAGADKSKE
jgi:hypothetical protein